MMRLAAILFFILFGIINSSRSTAGELSGYISAEGSFFFNAPLFPGQKDNNLSVASQPEYYHEWDSGSSFIFVPFARLDSADDERSHFDIRELNYLWLSETWELRLGLGKVFWGAVEFVHLVDIINQTDLVESIDGEEKLGQPMAHLSVPKNWGVIDLFVLPWFRERTFPGKEGRSRTEPVVDTERARFDSSDEEHHLDIAIRYSHSIHDADIGIYYFRGTGRDPTLIPATDTAGNPILLPFYEQIDEAGVDIQKVAGEWLYKFEGLYRSGQGESFAASACGVEYTYFGIADSTMDLGIIGEWVYDSRQDQATTAYQNDAILGLRLEFNDAASSQLLIGWIEDLKNSSRIFSLETNRRLGENIKLTLEGRAYSEISKNDPAYGLRDDDFVKIDVAYYF